MRHLELGRDGGAVTVVPVEQLEDSGRLPEPARQLERRLVAYRIDEPHAPVHGERVRGAGCGLVDDPREPARAPVVAEADRHRRAYVALLARAARGVGVRSGRRGRSDATPASE